MAIMNIKINGETRDLPIGQTVRDIVLLHNLTPEKVEQLIGKLKKD